MSRNGAPEAASLASEHLDARWDAARIEHNLARVGARTVARARWLRASATAAAVVVLALVAFVFRGNSGASARLAAPRPLELRSAAALGAKTTFVDGSVARVSMCANAPESYTWPTALV